METSQSENLTHQRMTRKTKILAIICVVLILPAIIITAIIFIFFNQSPQKAKTDILWNAEITLTEFESLTENDKYQLFDIWMKDSNRSYASNDDRKSRFTIWKESFSFIALTNSLNVSYKLRMNTFSDMSYEEWSDIYMVNLYLNASLNGTLNITHKRRLQSQHVPEHIDWASLGHVTPAADQGECRSCWAFATAGCLECKCSIRRGKHALVSLSKQQLVDCSDRDRGCSGSGHGLKSSFLYLQDLWDEPDPSDRGLCLESDYPYVGQQRKCNASRCAQAGETSMFQFYARHEWQRPSYMQEYVAEGCVTAAVEANNIWMFWGSGILSADVECGYKWNHAVLIVGYGVDHWIVKNSWGNVDWGENGFIRICRNCGKNGVLGQCGIEAFFGTVSCYCEFDHDLQMCTDRN
eukprot:103309_1